MPKSLGENCKQNTISQNYSTDNLLITKGQGNLYNEDIQQAPCESDD